MGRIQRITQDEVQKICGILVRGRSDLRLGRFFQHSIDGISKGMLKASKHRGHRYEKMPEESLRLHVREWARDAYASLLRDCYTPPVFVSGEQIELLMLSPEQLRRSIDLERAARNTYDDLLGFRIRGIPLEALNEVDGWWKSEATRLRGEFNAGVRFISREVVRMDNNDKSESLVVGFVYHHTKYRLGKSDRWSYLAGSFGLEDLQIMLAVHAKG